MKVVVAARCNDLLGRVADDIGNVHGVETRAVTLDLADPAFLASLRSATDGLEVGLVVYNATGVYTGEFEDQTLDSMRSMVTDDSAYTPPSSAILGSVRQVVRRSDLV